MLFEVMRDSHFGGAITPWGGGDPSIDNIADGTELYYLWSLKLAADLLATIVKYRIFPSTEDCCIRLADGGG